MTRRVPLGSRDGSGVGAGARATLEEVRGLVEVLVKERCEGFSGADLAALVREAGVIALRGTLGALDEMDSGADAGAGAGVGAGVGATVTVEVADSGAALGKVNPSVSLAQRRKYEALRSKSAGLPARAGKDEEEKRVEEKGTSSTSNNGGG